MSFFSGIALLSLLTTALAAPLLESRQSQPCNGDVSLCSKIYSNVSFVGSHDSAFVGALPTQNQIKSLTDQLNSGSRFLTAQTHSFLGTVSLCHTSCLEEDAGLAKSYLQTVKTWLDNNPREVVTLLWTNPNSIPMSTYDSIVKSVGAGKYVFTPSSTPNALAVGDWPTLEQMIDAGTRLVMFIGRSSSRYLMWMLRCVDYGANANQVPYLLDEFEYFFETPFDATSLESCTMDRQNKLDADGKSSMYIVNHFLDVQLSPTNVLVPNRNAAAGTNAATGQGSIGDQVNLCVQAFGRYPNVVLVDFFGSGNEMQAEQAMNEVAASNREIL
jgi:hypothetical protein